MLGRNLFFDNQTTMHAATVFGSLFSNIYTKRDDELVAVPLQYAGVEKHKKARENDGEERSMVGRQLPMMSFNLSNMNYDSVKKVGNGKQLTICCENDEGQRATTMHSAPWILGFVLSIKTKTLTEGYQILEQIIPYFSPTLNVRIQSFPDHLGECKFDRSDITLVGIDPQNDYEGEFNTKRELQWTLDFTMTVNYYGFLHGYPGVAAGIGGEGINGVNVEVGAGYCGDNAEKTPIEHIFINQIIDNFNFDGNIGIPEDGSLFLPESGKEGHVSTYRVDAQNIFDADPTNDDEVVKQGTDYPRIPESRQLVSYGVLFPFQVLMTVNEVLPYIEEVGLSDPFEIPPISSSFNRIISPNLISKRKYMNDIKIIYGGTSRYDLVTLNQTLIDGGMNPFVYLPRETVSYDFQHASYQDITSNVLLSIVPSEDVVDLVARGQLSPAGVLTVENDILANIVAVGISDNITRFNIQTSEFDSISTVSTDVLSNAVTGASETDIDYSGHTYAEIDALETAATNIYAEMPRVSLKYRFTDDKGLIEYFDVQVVVTKEDP